MAVVIYKTSDRIPVKIGGVSFKISPMTAYQKAKITQASKKMTAGEVTEDTKAGTFLAVKYCVKEVKGIVDTDGNEYQLEFEENGELTDSCVDDLLNTSLTSDLINTCVNFISGVPDRILDADGTELKGVKIEHKKPKKK